MISERLERLEKALAIMGLQLPMLVVDVPVRLRNTSNSRDGWHSTAKRAKVVRTFTRAAVRSRILKSVLVKGSRFGTAYSPLPCSVRLVYIGPRQLDDDGVVSAVKSLRDGVADALGVDDRDPRVVWVPDQERGGVREYGARVEIYLSP
jgi:hypothetical protein